MIHNTHVAHNTVTNTSRIFKETKSLADAGLVEDVEIVGFGKEGLPSRQPLDSKREITRLPLRLDALPRNSLTRVAIMSEYIVKALKHLRKNSISVFHAHSLETLVIGILLRRGRNARMKIVYDAHELETERHRNGPLLRGSYKVIERILIHKADAVIVVGDMIAEWYKKTYSLGKVTVIKNIPRKPDSFPAGNRYLREHFSISDNEKVFLYLGTISIARNIPLLLSVFSQINPENHFICMGYGDMTETVKEYSRKHANIHYHAAVPPEKILECSGGADVGLSLIPNTCLSYYYSLPNKFFEYILSGLPVLASNFPEMQRTIDAFDCGWYIKPESESLRNFVESLDSEELLRKESNALKAREGFDWAEEEKKLFDIYRSITT